MFRLFLVFAASTLLLGCGSATSPSPTETTVNRAEMIWVDPSGTQMFVQVGLHYMQLVTLVPKTTLVPRTIFRGDITSADQLVATYRAGNLIRVDVSGHTLDEGTDADVAARVVTASVSWAGTGHVEKLRVRCDSHRPFRVIDLYKSFIIMPWTTFDPGGDITSYDAFLAVAAADEHVYLEGDGWIVGVNALHMRSVKITWK